MKNESFSALRKNKRVDPVMQQNSYLHERAVSMVAILAVITKRIQLQYYKAALPVHTKVLIKEVFSQRKQVF